MIFPRPALGLGIGTGPYTTSGLGLLIVIVIPQVDTRVLPSKKSLGRKRQQSLDVVATHYVDKLPAGNPLAIEVYLPQAERLVLPKKVEWSPLGVKTDVPMSRRSRILPDRKPRY